MYQIRKPSTVAMPKKYKIIDEDGTYQLKSTDRESLKKIVRAILSDNIAQLQRASIDWV